MCFSDWLLVLTLEHRLTPVVFLYVHNYLFTMSITNPYVAQIVQQTGCTEREARQSSPNQARTFPCTIHGRHFATEADYQDELHEFSHGM